MPRFIKFQFIYILFSLLAYLVCYSLQSFFDFNFFIASATTGLLGSLIPHSSFFCNRKAQAVTYAVSFTVVPPFRLSYAVILIFLTPLIFIAFEKKFEGYGGKLGTIAFLASISMVILCSQF